MFLKRRTRTKDGKTHACYSVCESLRVSRDRVIQRQVLHLGDGVRGDDVGDGHDLGDRGRSPIGGVLAAFAGSGHRIK